MVHPRHGGSFGMKVAVETIATTFSGCAVITHSLHCILVQIFFCLILDV